MAEEKKATTEKVVIKEVKVDVEAFIERKLKALNQKKNKAQVKIDAERVLANRELGDINNG